MNGTWVIDAGFGRWRIIAHGSSVETTAVGSDDRSSDCIIAGAPRGVLALLLGRPTERDLVIEGEPNLAMALKRAFPGP